MKDRIRLIMEHEKLTPSAFADRLQIGRAVISHILNGRNNTSLDVVTRILSEMNYIDPDWLLSGKGVMLKLENQPSEEKEKTHSKPHPELPNLFSEDLFVEKPVIVTEGKDENKYHKENIVEPPKNMVEEIIKERIIYQKEPNRKISKIIIYYNDNTFETFNTDSNPL